MRTKFLLLVMLSTTFLGCATGHFRSLPLAINQTIIKDCVQRLSSLYPPARTHFRLQQSANDAFNFQLNQSLRQTGYSLNESTRENSSSQGLQNMTLHAFVDEPIKGSLFRVTLMVGNQSLSRAYRLKKGVIKPVGFWVRKE